jgi:Uma2 family endonuclease
MLIEFRDDGRMPLRRSFRRSMSVPAKKPRATYQDLLRVPEPRVAEILEGELVVSPRPAGRHAVAAAMLAGHLAPLYIGGPSSPPGWWILSEPELHLNEPEDVAVPDLCGWRRERLPRPPAGVEFRVPPDWVCEVLSPATERVDRSRKLRIYARAGVSHVWLLNPVERLLEVLRRDGERWMLVGACSGDEVVTVEPFSDVPLPLGDLWLDSTSDLA